MTRSFSFLKGLLGLVGLFIILVAASINSDAAPVKRVFLQQHTGAWCGWCVDGSYVVDQLYKKYPDQMIGVKMHNGDKMVIPEEGALGTFFAIEGYPSAMIDRKANGGAYFINRGSWQSIVEAYMKEAPLADVAVTQTIANGVMTVTVTGEALADITKQLAWSVYVCEDYVVGTGTGYDQSNYLSGRAGYEDNPYYKLPAKITGYKHMAVVRAILGGAYGDKTKFAATGVKKGDKFEQVFTYTIPAGQNPDAMYAVAVIQENGGTKETSSVLNCAATPRNLLKDVELTVVGEKYNFVDPAKGLNYEFTLKNANDFAIPATLSFNTKSSVIPDTWGPTLKSKEVTVPAKGELKVQMDLTADKTDADFASIKIDIKNNFVGKGYLAVDNDITINALSTLTKSVIWGATSYDPYKLQTVVKGGNKFAKTSAVVPLEVGALAKYKHTNFDLEVFQVNFFSSTFYGNDETALAARKEITDLLAAGKKVLIANEAGSSVPSTYRTVTPEATAWFKTFGITKKANGILSLTLDANGQISGLVQYPGKGIKGQFTEGIDILINNDDSDMNNMNIMIDNIKVASPSTAIMNLVNDDGVAINVVGAKYNNTADGRMVYYGFTFESLADDVRTDLINKSIAWLFDPTDVNDNVEATNNTVVYPNPADNVINISGKESIDQNYTLINLLGEVVATGVNTNNKIDINNLNSGCYYIQINGATHKFVKK